ncbi:hypothetical protein [Geodermatophilus obscurus]|nr:hypothetical protein [Geodermatophilus obscurus]
MRGDRDDASVPRSGPGLTELRTTSLVAGFLLAVAATVVVFLTEDPQVLRLAVVAAAWAFVLAALVASRRTPDGASADGPAQAAVERAAVELADLQRAAAEREAELRLAPELELEREGAARREHELRLENDLRRTADRSMRAELEALRTELAQVSELRREMAQLAELRRDLAGLAELRPILAGLDLTGLAELRTDVGRLRSELTEQLSGEMLVERVMLRTQSTRTAPAAPGATAPSTSEADGWNRPVPELTAAWPAVRTDEPAPGTRRPEEVRVEPQRPAAPPPPLDRPAGRSLLDAPPPPHAEPEPRRRRTDDLLPVAAPVEQLTVERPVAQRERPPVPGPAAPAPAAEAPAPAAEAPAPAAEDSARRLTELLAESGLTPPSGGRRRRRYREDGESDDVLARVLGRS